MVEMKSCDCFERLASIDTGTCPDPIDPNGHRYLFWERWGPEPPLIIIMLNPAGHRAGESGRTRDRVSSFARQMGAGGVITANAFALCSPKPKCLGLVDRDRAVGLENDDHLRALRAMSPRIVVAWGAYIEPEALRWRVPQLAAILGNVECWGTTDGGSPLHPGPKGRIRDDSTLRPYVWPDAR
jgi:hypothetical protein